MGTMASEHIQRQIERPLDEVGAATDQRYWVAVRDSANAVLRLEPDN